MECGVPVLQKAPRTIAEPEAEGRAESEAEALKKEPQRPPAAAPDPVEPAAVGVGVVAEGAARRVLSNLRSSGRRRSGAAASAARARLHLPEPVSRLARRALTRSVGDLYLELGFALTKAERFAEASDAFDKALEEGVSEVSVLADLAEAARRAGATEIAARALLELALLEPAKAGGRARGAAELLDDAVVASQGRWIVGEWYERVQEVVDDAGGRAECALVVTRAALLDDDGQTAERVLREALEAHEPTAAAAARTLLRPERLGPRLRAHAASGHALLARLAAQLGRQQEALDHIAAALAAGVAGDEEAELPLIELRAEVLRRAERRVEAADAYVDAGRRHDLALRHPIAVQRFEQATELHPENALAFWYLADSRRLAGELPEYPYVDRALLERAQEAWEEGLHLARPGRQHAWALVAGALILEPLAQFAEHPGTLLLRAAVQAEQAAALDETSTDAWATLCRCHRRLGHPAVALAAGRRAVALGHDSTTAQLELVKTAALLGTPDALDLLAEYADRSDACDDPAVLALHGHALVVRGELEPARERFSRSLASGPRDAAVRARTALLHAVLGDAGQARVDAEAVWAQCSPPRADTPQGHLPAIAALLLSRPGDARALFDAELRRLSREDAEVLAGLAAATYAEGNGDTALGLLRRAVEAVRHPGDAAVVRLHLDLLERLVPQASADVRLGRHDLEAVLAPVADGESSSEAALGELARSEQEAPEGGPAWVVARAGRARVLADAERSTEAIPLDESLLPFQDPLEGFPAGRDRLARNLRVLVRRAANVGDVPAVEALMSRLIALGSATPAEAALAVSGAQEAAGRSEVSMVEADRAVQVAESDGHLDVLRSARLRQGDLLLRRGSLTEADGRYRQALDLTSGEDRNRRLRADVHARLAVVAALREDVAGARAALRQALEVLRPTVGRTAAARALTADAERVADEVGGAPALAAAFRTLLEDPELTGQERRRLTSARYTLRRERHGAGPRTAVSQVSIRVDPGLLGGEEDGMSRRLRDRELPALRRRLLERRGVRVPGVRLRSDGLLADGRFELLINEIPYVAGRVPQNGRLAVDHPEAGEGALVNPWSGERAVWVPEGADDGGERSLERREGLLWLLEGLLLTHLAQFVGLAEVEYQLDRWVADGGEQREDLLKLALPHRRMRTRLVAVLRRLVQEQVPIHQTDVVLSTMARLSPEAPVVDLVEATRAELARVLPGIGDDRERLEVPGRVEDAVRRVDGELPVATAAALLPALRMTIGARAPGGFVLVVRDSATRVTVQHLAERVLPSVAVLAEAELAAAAGRGRRPAAAGASR